MDRFPLLDLGIVCTVYCFDNKSIFLGSSFLLIVQVETKIYFHEFAE